MSLSKDFEGRKFVRTSPVTGAQTEGIIKDIFYTYIIAEDSTLKLHFHLRSTNGVVYDLSDCRIVPTDKQLETLRLLKKPIRLKKKP